MKIRVGDVWLARPLEFLGLDGEELKPPASEGTANALVVGEGRRDAPRRAHSKIAMLLDPNWVRPDNWVFAIRVITSAESEVLLTPDSLIFHYELGTPGTGRVLWTDES